ncbi:MAG TPA: lytic murein transglycosylase, partial [Xanthomonadaceae bacterium]|nr:lytic murein transglycosylase [Xanthomonadaceae bacterium]
MKNVSIPILAALALLCAGAVSAQNLDNQRAAVRSAIDAAEAGRYDAGQAAALSRHPLYGWLEYANLKRNIDNVGTAQAQDFLRRYAGQPVAEAFRGLWLPALARRQDWPTLLANWKPTDNAGLRCAELNARQATGKADAQWTRDAQALWRGA